MAEAVVREPTMEAILSSIRKIISDEGEIPEETPKPKIRHFDAVDPAPVSALEPKPVREASSAARITADMGAQTLQTESAAHARENRPRPFDRSLSRIRSSSNGNRSFADIATTVKAMDVSAVQINHLVGNDVEFMENDITNQAVHDEASNKVEAITDNHMPEEAIDTSQKCETEKINLQSFDSQTPHIGLAAATAAHSEPHPVAENTNKTVHKGNLISPAPSEAVIGSFDRLKRSVMDDVDAKTEDILRPMLREWLDENLPNLVERLVREEIERVANR